MDAYTRLRVNAELKAAGATWFGMRKFAIKYLPEYIEPNEHVKGVVYGRYADDGGNLKLNAGLLAATNKRVIFLDHKPGYTRMDEIAYSVIGGVEILKAVKASVELHTSAGNYKISYANPKCAQIFVNYVDKQLMRNNNKNN